MAKRTSKSSGSNTRTSSRRTNNGGRSSTADFKRSMSQKSNYYQDRIQEFFARPAVKYVAGGLAAAALTRLALKFSDRFPEVSGIVRDSLETMESRLSEFRGGGDSELTDEARH